MTLTRFNNSDLVKDFSNDVFLRNLSENLFGKNSFACTENEPNYKVIEQEKSYALEVAIPGLSKDDINIKLDNGILTVETTEREEKDERTGFASLEFSKTFQLSKKVNQDKIEAKIENGLLSINLPKIEAEIKKPTRTIAIS